MADNDQKGATSDKDSEVVAEAKKEEKAPEKAAQSDTAPTEPAKEESNVKEVTETKPEAPVTPEPTQPVEKSDDDMSYEELRVKYELPASWDDDHIADWVTYADKKKMKTSSGNWMYDPYRDMNDPSFWPISLVKDWMNGELPGSDEKSPLLKAVTRRFAQRTNLSSEWSPIQVFNYHRNGVKPATTSRDNVVESETRPHKKASQWSDSELADWVNDELKATHVASDQQLADETRERFKLINEAKTMTDVKKAFQQGNKRKAEPTPEGLTDEQAKVIRDEMELYIKRTAPNVPINATSGRRAQKGLQWVFDYCLKLEGKAFVSAWDLVTGYVHKYRKANFDETYAYRFVGEIQNASQRAYHTGILACLLIVGGELPLMIRQTDTSLYLETLGEHNAARMGEYFKQYANRQ